MKLTGAQILWEALVREGVTDVFGYPGGAILPAYDAMLQYPIRHVLVRHEQGATHMADGYARATGKVGVAIATSGPGATNMVTGIATDAQQASCEVDWEKAEPQLSEAFDDALPGDGDVHEAMDLIAAAERPLILAGHGVMLSGAERRVIELAERAQIPIAVTLLGIGGVAASHPLNLGMMGMHGEGWVNNAIQEADLLIALGMRFDDRVTGNLKTYARSAKKIHVDIDRAELNKNVRVDVTIDQ